MTVPNAIKLIERMSEELDKNIILGVGSVLNKSIAEEAIKAGAKYVVSPVLKKKSSKHLINMMCLLCPDVLLQQKFRQLMSTVLI